jgi:hypothetical protein
MTMPVIKSTGRRVPSRMRPAVFLFIEIFFSSQKAAHPSGAVPQEWEF